MVGYIWLDTHGWIRMVGYAWLDTHGWIRMVGYTWLDTHGWIHMVGYTWLDTHGWIHMVDFVVNVASGRNPIVGIRRRGDMVVTRECASILSMLCFW